MTVRRFWRVEIARKPEAGSLTGTVEAQTSEQAYELALVQVGNRECIPVDKLRAQAKLITGVSVNIDALPYISKQRAGKILGRAGVDACLDEAKAVTDGAYAGVPFVLLLNEKTQHHRITSFSNVPRACLDGYRVVGTKADYKE